MQHSEEKVYKPYGTLNSECKTKGTLCRPQLQGGNNMLRCHQDELKANDQGSYQKRLHLHSEQFSKA